MRVIYKRVRELLNQHFPNESILIEDSNSNRSTMMMFPLGEHHRINIKVNLSEVLNALENKGPFADANDFLDKIGIAKWNIKHFNEELTKVLNKDADKKV
jgi:hypothetical protein